MDFDPISIDRAYNFFNKKQENFYLYILMYQIQVQILDGMKVREKVLKIELLLMDF